MSLHETPSRVPGLHIYFERGFQFSPPNMVSKRSYTRGLFVLAVTLFTYDIANRKYQLLD